MISLYELPFYLNNIIYFLYTYCNILYNKYIRKNDIILYTTNCKKYDKIHDLIIIYCIFNIQIHTYRNMEKKYKRNIIYKDNIKLSDVSFINEIPINGKENNIELHIVFLDNLYITNQLIIYNCGILIHENFFISHIYNYLSNRRNYNKRL